MPSFLWHGRHYPDKVPSQLPFERYIRKKNLRPDMHAASRCTLHVGNMQRYRTLPGNVFAYWMMLVEACAAPNARHTGVYLLDVDCPHIDLPDNTCHGT